MKIFKSGLVIAFFTLLSRIFGLARELFIAYLFGATSAADCVNVAFKLPNLFRRIFAEGALSSVFVPIFNEKMLKSKNEAVIFTGTIFTMLITSLIIIIVVMQIFMPYLLFLIAPGFKADPEKFELTILLCRITISYLLLMSVVALFGSILNSVKKFAAFAFSPVILSFVIILGTIILQEHIDKSIAISISIIVAGILQVIFMLICVIRAKLSFPMIFDYNNNDSKKFLKNMLPAIISSGVQQLNIFISQSISSFIPGTISILSYADRIYQFPLSIIGVTFSTMLLPELSKIYKQNNIELAAKVQNQAIIISMLFSIPSVFGIIALADPIIHIIYEHGLFTNEDSIKTARVLSIFALALPAFVLSKILTPIFYANSDTKTPMIITIYSMIINSILNILLMIPFGYIGIALGSSISAWINIYLLRRNIPYNWIIDKDIKLFVGKILFASIIMYIVIIINNNYYGYHYYGNSILIKVIFLAFTIKLAIICFFLVMFLLGFKNYIKIYLR
jgi:putative peptidoglycan lipid II flippase